MPNERSRVSDNNGDNNVDEANLEDLLIEEADNNEDEDDPEFMLNSVINSVGDSSSEGSDLSSASDLIDIL